MWETLATTQRQDRVLHGAAKLLNLLWTFALARDLADSGVVVNAVNPGMAWTPGTQALTPEAVPAWRYIWPVVRFFQKRAKPESAARAPVLLASAAEFAYITGRYYESKGKPADPSAAAKDQANQDRAVELARQLVQQAPTSAAA